MTFSAFLHALTTSRYTRSLEQENEHLQESLDALTKSYERLALSFERMMKRSLMNDPETETTGTTSPTVIPRRQRPGRFVSFGAEKRRLENQEAPQRSVTS